MWFMDNRIVLSEIGKSLQYHNQNDYDAVFVG